MIRFRKIKVVPEGDVNRVTILAQTQKHAIEIEVTMCPKISRHFPDEWGTLE